MFFNRNSLLIVLTGIGIFLAALLFAQRLTASADTTITVNSDDDTDDGLCNVTHCSLREAINLANLTPGTDTITFNIPGIGPHTIRPDSQLPWISDSAIIDGYTQPGAKRNTNQLGAGSNASLMIELDGSNIGGQNDFGLNLQRDSIIRGLVVNNFSGRGISGVSNNVIEGNFVGTDITGKIAMSNGRNVETVGTENTIGGTSPSSANIISGSSSGPGVSLFVGSSANKVQGNYIGTQVDGSTPLGNASSGVYIDTGFDNLIGGTNPGEGNIIAFNRQGVYVRYNGTGNAILSNTIFSNTLLGIDLEYQGVNQNDPGDADSGANNLQNFPVLTSVQSNSTLALISGTINSSPNTHLQLDFYSNHSCDPSGFGEGEAHLGSVMVTTDATGNAGFRTPVNSSVPVGNLVTATATDLENNSSEFSKCIEVEALNLPFQIAIPLIRTPD